MCLIGISHALFSSDTRHSPTMPVFFFPRQEYFSQFQGTTAVSLVASIFLCACESRTHSRASKKNTSHGNEVLALVTTHRLQRPCHQRGSPCQAPAGNRTTGRPPDHRKETQTIVVWTCVPFIRSCQNHLSRHSERGKKTRQTEEDVGRQDQGMDRPGVHQAPEGSGEQRGTWL